MKYRTLFLSDIHLATRACRAEELLGFLKAHDADTVYLVGDIVDFWRLRRGARWRPAQTAVIKELLRKARRGARLVYIPGNHDDEIRSFSGMGLGPAEVRLREVHVTASGRRFLIVHGDEFDPVMQRARWLAILGDVGYDLAFLANAPLNAVRRLFGLPYWSLSAYLKARVKRAVNAAGNFEMELMREARKLGAQGVICGHIHQAAMRETGGMIYVNTGDWLESCTAAVEHFDGRIEIIRWLETRQAPVTSSHDPRRAAAVG